MQVDLPRSAGISVERTDAFLNGQRFCVHLQENRHEEFERVAVLVHRLVLFAWPSWHVGAELVQRIVLFACRSGHG